jgi:arylformamidase
MSDAIYRGYDKESLDAQYNLRPLVPDFQEYFDRYAAESATARDTLGGTLDIAYGPQDGEKLDVFAPDGAEGAPVHVFIHGGYWQSHDKSTHDFVANGLVPRGAVTVVVNYTLAPDVSVAEIVRQNRSALAWAWRNIADFGGDPANIHVSGHSAGGHLTAMMASTDWPAFEDGLPADLVKSGLCISGLFEMEPIQLCYLNDVLGMSADEAIDISPTLLSPPVGVRQIVTVGGEETDEFLRQSADYVAALKARGTEAEGLTPAGLHHFSIVAQLGRPDGELTDVACRLMGLE